MGIRGKRFLKYHEHDILTIKADPIFARPQQPRPRPGRDGAVVVEGAEPIKVSLDQVPVEVRHNVSRGNIWEGTKVPPTPVATPFSNAYSTVLW